MRIYDKIQELITDIHTSVSVHTPIMVADSVANSTNHIATNDEGITYKDFGVHISDMPYLNPYEMLMREYNILSISFSEQERPHCEPEEVHIEFNVIDEAYWGAVNPQAASEGGNTLPRVVCITGNCDRALKIEDANENPLCVQDIYLRSVTDFYAAVSNYNRLFNSLGLRVVEKTTGNYPYLRAVFGSFDRGIARRIIGKTLQSKLLKITTDDGASFKNSFVHMLCNDDQFTPNEFVHTLDAFQNMIDLRSLNEEVASIIEKSYA
jgi:hypothetical protein